MKIALTGSAGCGKTTLAEALAARLGVPVVPEMYDGFFDEQGEYLRPAAALARKIDEVLEAKRALESAAGDFVADRCPLDLLVLWFGLGYGQHDAPTTILERKCRNYTSHYDAVVLPPWTPAPPPQVESGTSRRRRNLRPWVLFRNHCTTLGLAMHWLPTAKLIAIPANLRTPDERCDFILRTLDERQRVRGSGLSAESARLGNQGPG